MVGFGKPENATPKSKKYGPLPQLMFAKGLPLRKVPVPITKFTKPNWSVVTFCRSE
jgi:hypothetical protein